MIPSDTYASQQGTAWMQKVMKRIDYENGKTSDPIFSWLPLREERCYNDYPSAPLCRSGLYVMDGYGSDKDGNQITNANFQQMIKKLSPNPQSDYFWKGRESRLSDFPNLGVNLTVVFSKMLDNDQGYNFKVDPVQWTSTKNTFCTPKNGGYTIITRPGDTSVPSTSAVTPAVKFAEDFDNNVPNAKPVKLLELCSG
jgi:hypothetical protein